MAIADAQAPPRKTDVISVGGSSGTRGSLRRLIPVFCRASPLAALELWQPRECRCLASGQFVGQN